MRQYEEVSGLDRCERIWRSNLHIMLNIARARLWNKQDAEDLVQDVTFAFWRKYTDVDYLPDDRLCMYLFGILRNKIADSIKARKREQEHLVFVDNVDALKKGELSSAEIEAANRIAYQGLIELISTLPPKYALTIALKFGLGLSDPEVARALDLKPSSVRMTAYQAKAKLLEAIMKRDAEEEEDERRECEQAN